MLTVTDADDFFAAHPSRESFSGFTEEQKNDAISGAARDIAAALGWDALPGEPEELLKAALFEQTLYLLLNPHIAAAATPELPLIAPKAQMMLDGFITRMRAGHGAVPGVRLARG